MNKLVPVLIILLISSSCFAQLSSFNPDDSIKIIPDTTRLYIDSTIIESGDSVVVYDDTLGIYTDTLSTADTTGLLTAERNLAIPDTVVPLFGFPLSDNSLIISNKEIKGSNFRYTDDLLNLYTFAFLRDKGSIGYPSDMLITLTQNINYMVNGIPLNNSSGYYDLNNFQSENIDSIEIISPVRGFLHDIDKNTSTVNYISRDFLSVNPFTRVKYYQGVNGEAMFDGMFNSILFENLFGYLDVTNRKLDNGYQNTSFSSWQVTSKLRYLLTDNINLTGSYSFSSSVKGLNGGINIDSITNGGIIDEELMFDDRLAPVLLYDHEIKQKLHNFDFRILAQPVKELFTDASFYYHLYEQELNSRSDDRNLYNRNKDKAFGLVFRQYYTNEFFKLSGNANYEKIRNESNNTFLIDTTYSFLNATGDIDRFNASAVLDLTISDLFKPSVFYKYSTVGKQNSRINRNGFGADISIKPTDHFQLYSGYSYLVNHLNGEGYSIFNAAASLDLAEVFIKGELFLKSKEYMDNNPANILTNPGGIAGTINYRFGSFIIENTSTYYFSKEELNGVPSLLTNGGIFFSDSLFQPNLYLKTGFAINFWAERKIYYNASLLTIPADYRLDFLITGEIRDAATIYFTWENILDRKYYLIPYYPMPQSNIRFGIAWELFN